ncbi:MAG: hypothetical protein H6825_04310 [Planctomycetes bacterium]|nr:hypothetical protein [Planctomycetota bacterium]
MTRWTKSLLISVAVVAACRAVGPEGTDAATGDVASTLSEPTLLADPSTPTATGVTKAATPTPDDEERARRELLEQKTYLLVQQYLQNARALEEKLDFDGAQAALERARAIDPTNEVVLTYLRQIQALAGDGQDASALLHVTARERYEAQQQQMITLALNDLDAARQALETEDFDRAVFLVRGVVNRISWSPEVDWGRVADDARAMLDEAESLRDAHADKVKRVQQEEAFAALKAEEDQVAQQEDLRLRTLLIAATKAFDRGDYEAAQEISHIVLESDQHNSQALAILDAAQDAAREYADRVFVQRRREEFNRWRNEMEKIRIPHTDILTLDKRRWAEVNKLRGDSAAALELGDVDPEEQALRAKIASTRIENVDFEELAIDQVANNIYFTTDIPVSVDPEVVLELDDNAEYVTLQNLRNVTVQSLLNILVDQVGAAGELVWTIRNGRVYITKREKANAKLVPRVHPIQDLTFKLTDFKGPSLRSIALPGEAGDDNETTIFNSEVDSVTLIDSEEILNLVRENIAPQDWEQEGYSIDFVENGNLLVIHTPEVQAQVAQFLDDLRTFSTSMVTLESRFYSITDSFIEEIGTDLRGLDPQGVFANQYSLDAAGSTGNPTQGLDNQGDGTGDPSAGIFYEDVNKVYAASTNNFFNTSLGDMLSTIGGGAFQFSILNDTQVNIVMNLVAKSENATEITAPMVSVYNTQRAFVTVVNQVSYVQGFEVDVATAAFIADPVIGVVQEGIVLDVRPTISYDRKYITLDVQTTVAELERPFQEITTLLGPNGTPVTFAIPVLNVQDAQTTVVVPDGGAVVLGGFKHVRYKNRTAETPWFADIPFLGFFFREKGLADEVTDLIVVIRAKITDFSNLREAPATTR